MLNKAGILIALIATAGWMGCDDDDNNLCGNDRVDRGETCDASAVGGRTCIDEGFAGGTLSCNTTCDDYDTSSCWTHFCGNNIEEAGELCDGDDLGGNSCETLGMGYDGGTLVCNAACDGFVTTGCTLPDTGGIEGSVSLDAGLTCDASTAATDCLGDVYLAVVPSDPTVNPNQVPLSSTMIEDVDFIMDATALYSLVDVPAGTWWLTGFLDDNNSVTPTGRAPDAGDPVITPFQVTVTADATTMQNVSFTIRLP